MASAVIGATVPLAAADGDGAEAVRLDGQILNQQRPSSARLAMVVLRGDIALFTGWCLQDGPAGDACGA
jgi:hypothetical protein